LGAISVVGADALDERGGHGVTGEKHPGALAGSTGANRPPLEMRKRGPVTDRALGKTTTYQPNFSRTAFDAQHLARFAGYVVLAWREHVDPNGTKLGTALVRLPTVADVDLVVEIHVSRHRLWAEAAADTPRRCRRRLECDLQLLANLIARAIGGDAPVRMLSKSDGET
jgi:non-ribosomal peptide synthetase component F